MRQVATILSQRLDRIAPKSTSVTVLDTRRVRVAADRRVADDPVLKARVIAACEAQGVLEFRIVAERNPANPERIDSVVAAYCEPIGNYTQQLAEHGPATRPAASFLWIEIATPRTFHPAGNAIVSEHAGSSYVLAYATPDMGLLRDGTWSITQATPVRDQRKRWSVRFTLDAAGGQQFERLTQAGKMHPLCIILDNKAITAPIIQSAIREQGQVTGNFTHEEVTRLCDILPTEPLPVALNLVKSSD